MAFDIGPRIGIDGEAEYRKQINSINTTLKTLSTELQAVTSQFDKNDKSQEALTAQNAVLNKQIDVQKEKLSALQDMLAKSAEKYGVNDDKTQKWQQTINKATTDLNNMERQLAENNKTLGKTDDFTADASGGVNDFAKNIEDASDKSTRFADNLKANLLSQVIIKGLKEIASAAKDMAKSFVESAASVKAETAQFEQAFGEFADKAEESIKRVSDASGILPTRLNTVATSIYGFAKASGGTVAQSLDIMESSLQAAADGAAYYDKSLEEVSASLMSFLKGNFANDAALGVSATETTRNAKAMELFGQKYNELSEIQKQQTLLKMVTDAQKLSGAMGQASRESDGYENVVGNLKETWRQFMATVGTPILENLIPVIKKLTDKLKKLGESVNVEALSGAISGFFNFVLDNGSEIISLIAGIATAFVAWNVVKIVTGAVTALKAFKAANEGATLGVKLLDAATRATLIGVLVTVLMAVVAALIVLWNTNEDFRNAIIAIWENIKSAISGVVNAIVGFFTKTIPNAFKAVIDFIKENWKGLLLLIVNPFAGAFKLLYDNCEGFKKFINNFVNGIVNFFKTLPSRIADIFSNLVQKVKDKLAEIVNGFNGWVSDMVTAAKEAIPNLVDKIVEFFKELPGRMVEIGENMVKGIWEGIKNVFNWIKDKIKGFCDSISDGVKDAFGIASPSKLFRDEVGKNLAFGIGVGFEDAMKRVSNQMQSAIPLAFDGPSINSSGSYSSKKETQSSQSPTTGGDTFYITIDAKNVKDFNDVVSLAQSARQQRRSI